MRRGSEICIHQSEGTVDASPFSGSSSRTPEESSNGFDSVGRSEIDSAGDIHVS